MSASERHIAILDFGSQYMHLISRRIRQLGVRSIIYPTDVRVEDLSQAWGVIISGGPNSVGDGKAPYDPRLFDLPIPILGLCYGHQLMAHHYGGVVTPAHNREYGLAQVTITGDSPILRGLNAQEQVWMSHWDSVTTVPKGFSVIGTTSDCPVAAMSNETTQRYGFQFHPEVHHSTHGMTLLNNFVFDICQAAPNWSMEEYKEELAQDIRKKVGNKKVLLFVSGGVDSTVAFALLERILGKERVYGLYVDNGFMRAGETEEVQQLLARSGCTQLRVVDAAEKFLAATSDLVDPEAKRQAIGRVFVEVQQQVLADLQVNTNEWMLGQGTIYPDTIESGGTHTADTIKTHHNRVPEILALIERGQVIEPLATLYKDEVREIGKEFGLPDDLLNRWPFPGPGLSIRTLCSSGTPSWPEHTDQVQAALQQHAAPHGASASILPIRSVGVQGDQRSYQYPSMIWSSKQLDWNTLSTLSIQITNTVRGINRVVYWATPTLTAPELTLHEAYLTPDRLDLLRAADTCVSRIIEESGLHSAIWQFPIILLPLSTPTGAVVVLRPIESKEAMTVNWYHLPVDVFERLTTALCNLTGIGGVLLDTTNKPPATIEWE